MTRNLDVPDEYAALYRVYEDAYEQASEGKGKERHAEAGEPYEKQIICEVARRVGLGYPLGQAVKKIYESQRIGGERGVAELLGALNYVAAAVIVMREGLETAPKAEGCGYKPGDPVEWFSFGRKDAEADGWHPAFYLCKAGDPNYHVVQDIDGMYHVVNYANIRTPEAKYKPGDRVQYRDEIPSTSERIWVGAEYVRHLPDGRGHIVQDEKGGSILVGDKDIRPVPKAEGCEALVEKDAPQTPRELYRKIIASNPATFEARTPTGEELAEMAEEKPHG